MQRLGLVKTLLEFFSHKLGKVFLLLLTISLFFELSLLLIKLPPHFLLVKVNHFLVLSSCGNVHFLFDDVGLNACFVVRRFIFSKNILGLNSFEGNFTTFLRNFSWLW